MDRERHHRDRGVTDTSSGTADYISPALDLPAVHVAELDEWAWLLARIEDWLLHAHHETLADWAEFSGPCGPRIRDITDMLGHWSVRMRNLAQGRP